jgi:hypothetical protein
MRKDPLTEIGWTAVACSFLGGGGDRSEVKKMLVWGSSGKLLELGDSGLLSQTIINIHHFPHYHNKAGTQHVYASSTLNNGDNWVRFSYADSSCPYASTETGVEE